MDYLRYDPDPNDSRNNRPQVTFTFDNSATDHTYKCFVLLFSTGNVAGLPPLANIDSLADSIIEDPNDPQLSPGTLTETWNGSLISSSLTDQYGNFSYQLSTADQAPWGTYSYDVVVFEYDAEGNYIDRQDYKWPYSLKAGNHNDWFYYDSSSQSLQLRCYYEPDDVVVDMGLPNAEAPITLSMSEVGIDDHLNEHQAEEQGEAQFGIYQCGDDGLGVLVCTVPPGSTFMHDWRVIFTGEDSCWTAYRRDHLP